MHAPKSSSLVHVHADILEHMVPHEAQVEEPAADDAAAVPRLFEELEEALWHPEPEAPEAPEAWALADTDEVLHPVAGIELDA